MRRDHALGGALWRLRCRLLRQQAGDEALAFRDSLNLDGDRIDRELETLLPLLMLDGADGDFAIWSCRLPERNEASRARIQSVRKMTFETNSADEARIPRTAIS